MRLLFAATAALVTMTSLAGCTADDPFVPDASSYTLVATGVPLTIENGTAISFEVTVTGDGEWFSDHVGGHFWNEAQDDPTAAFSQAGGCQHVAGGTTVPSTYETSCTLPEVGEWYVRAHLRITLEDGTMHNYWGAEQLVVVTEPDAMS